MSFLNPFVLLALVAAGIPLIIHLFNFRRPRRIDFSTLTFVRELQKSTMQRVRLKQWLLLALRTLAILMLVLAFARPTLTGGLAAVVGGRGPSAVAIVVDNSPSMELRDVRGSYIDQARGLARAVAAQLEPGDKVFLMTTSKSERPSQAHGNAALVRDAIDEISLELNARPAREVLNDALELLANSEQVNREIYYIGDLQRSMLGDSLSLQPGSDVALVLLPVGQRVHANVAIEEVRVESPIVEVGAPARITASVRLFGGEAISDYSISVYLGDERVAQAPVDLQPGLRSEVSLVVTPQQQGWLGGRVEGEDDAFSVDNLRFFTMHVPERRRVLLVGGTESETRYLRLALTTGSDDAEGYFSVDQITDTELANRLANLGQYDAVVLAGSRVDSDAERGALEQYVENGGGLFVTPGTNQETSNLSRLLGALGGGRVAGVAGTRGASQAVAAFERIDAEHPIFAGVFDRDLQENEADVERARVFAAAIYEAASGNEHTLISLTNGSPFLQEIRHGRGGVLFLAVAPDPSWSDLPLRGLFVPMAYRALQYLSASERVQGEGLSAGSGMELRLAGRTASEPVRLVSPFGDEHLPEQRVVPGALLVQLDARDWVPGIYDLYVGEQRIRRLASNADPRESNLLAARADSVADVFQEESGAVVRALNVAERDEQDLEAAINARRSGIELWNVFLLLALLFLIAEMFVARQWRPEAVAT